MPPVKAVFSKYVLSYKSIYDRFRKWSKEIYLDKSLSKYRAILELSSIDLDGSHTPSLSGDEKGNYQGRKKKKPPICFF